MEEGVQIPPEKLQKISGFLAILVRIHWLTHTKPTFNVGASSARQRTHDDLLLLLFGSLYQLKQKNVFKKYSWTPFWGNFLDLHDFTGKICAIDSAAV